MKLYPIYPNIENRLAVIAGGGKVACRKLKGLLECGAKVKIVSPEIHIEIEELHKKNPEHVEIIYRKYQQGDIEGAFIVFAATGDTEINKSIFREAEEKNILINSADDPANCSFFIPSIARRGDLILAVSSSGASPAIAAKLRRKFEKYIPENIEDILIALREAREILKNMKNLSSQERGKILKKIIDDDKLLENLLQYKAKGTISSFFNCIFKIIP